jgi:hypothetical protein
MSENREKQTMKRKVPRSAWGPGQSGNPGGRPEIAAEVRDLAREHGSNAIARLVALMDSQNQTVALRAAEAVLDRGYGRPLQAMKLTEDPPEKPRGLDLTKLTDEELKEFSNARKAMRRLIEKYNEVPNTPNSGHVAEKEIT